MVLLLILAISVSGCERYKALDSEDGETLVYDMWKNKIYRVAKDGLEPLPVKALKQKETLPSNYKDFGFRRIPPPHDLYVSLEIRRISSKMFYKIIVQPEKPMTDEEVKEFIEKYFDDESSDTDESDKEQTQQSEMTEKKETETNIPKGWYKKVTESKRSYADITCYLTDTNGFMLKELKVGVKQFHTVLDSDGEVGKLEHQDETTIDDETFKLFSSFRVGWAL